MFKELKNESESESDVENEIEIETVPETPETVPATVPKTRPIREPWAVHIKETQAKYHCTYKKAMMLAKPTYKQYLLDNQANIIVE